MSESESNEWNCQAIIRRLCCLQSEVAAYQGYHKHSADCFCKEGGFWVTSDSYSDELFGGWSNDGLALEFIEQAVREKLKAMEAKGEQDDE